MLTEVSDLFAVVLETQLRCLSIVSEVFLHLIGVHLWSLQLIGCGLV